MYDEAFRLHRELAGRFVFMTGGAVGAASAELLKRSGCPVLLKPFDPALVRECIAEAARQPSVVVPS